jgi:hypothetical protein
MLMMNYADYLQHTERILSAATPAPPYDNPFYLEYTRLNFSRMNRWNKVLQLNDELSVLLKSIQRPQTWIIIAEPWCGDAAPALPFLIRLAELNPNIRYDIQLRDQEPFLIEQYLTNGGKSIPKLIVRDAEGRDLFTWGPRPASAQQLMEAQKAAGVEKTEISAALQNWYNADKGVEMQRELLELFLQFS